MDRITIFNFSDHFIEKLADHLMAYHDRVGSFEGLTLVFGGKRPALFLRREIARRLKRSFVPPRMLAMDEFIGDMFRSKRQARPLNDLEAGFELFQIARQQTPHILKGRETFARFWPWAREILGFIDQVDLEDIDDKRLLNVQAQASIGFDVPEAVNQMLSEIVILRRSLHAFLSENNLSRRGWMYAEAARHVVSASSAFDGDIWFCNFFYWHRTEENIIRHFFEHRDSRLFFQGDERRWPVLKAQASRLGVAIREGERVVDPDYDLKLYRVSDSHAECSVVRGLLSEMTPHDRQRTVVVVPESERLVPLLSEVIPTAEEFNVSMGYPLRRSSLFVLLQYVFAAQLSRNGRAYYARDYLKIFRHPLVKNMSLGHDPAVMRILAHKIEEVLTGKIVSPLSGRSFVMLEDIERESDIFKVSAEMLARLSVDVRHEELADLLRRAHDVFLRDWEAVQTFAGCGRVLQNMLDCLTQQEFVREYPLNMPIARRMRDFAGEWTEGRFSVEMFVPEDMFRILEDALGSEMIAFHGTPLKGLQILGLFETRSLNFDHVIVLDVNEGLLPRLQVTDPLIPREVNQALGISRLEIDEEIQRYQFLRLLSSAKSVHLIYQDNKRMERSRFVEQLMWYKERQQKNLGCVDVTQAGFAARLKPSLRCAEKTPAVIEHLRGMTFSASSINAYLRNPYEFYEKYVLGIREDDDLLDEPGAKEIGTFVHGLLQEAFEPFVGRPPVLDADFYRRFESLFEQRFTDSLARVMTSDAFLVKTVARERLRRFLQHETDHGSRRVVEIIGLEQKFKQDITLSCGTFKFVYVMDRIDRLQDGTILVLDYKTGGEDVMPASIGSWKDGSWDVEFLRERVRSFQIPLYHHYLLQAFPDKPVDAALYNLRKLEIKRFMSVQKGFESKEIDETFLRALDIVMSEMLDPKIPFVEKNVE